MLDSTIKLQDKGSGDRLCDFAATLDFAELPQDVREQNKLAILDVFGDAIAGAHFAEGAKEVRGYALSAGSGGRSTLWATGERCAAGLAALVNATHARGLDYDDIIPFPQIHVSVHVVPALAALTEDREATTTGRDFLTAMVVGCELQARLTRAIAPFFGSGLPSLLSSQIFGYFSAALACARLMRLDPPASRSALGLALMHAAGTEEMVVHATRSMGKIIYAGLSNQGGLQCAMMAAAGITAEGDALTGQAGLFAALYGGRFDDSALTEQLGSEFYSLNRCFKSAPGTLAAHSFAEAAILLKQDLGVSADDIQRIVLHVGSWGRAMCEPIELRRHPPSASAAMNSIPFVVAGESQKDEADPYQVLDGSCNRRKSWACEHCENWLVLRNFDTCLTCYWANPENYSHVAMRPERRIDVVWIGGEVNAFDTLKAEAVKNGRSVPDQIKALLTPKQ